MRIYVRGLGQCATARGNALALYRAPVHDITQVIRDSTLRLLPGIAWRNLRSGADDGNRTRQAPLLDQALKVCCDAKHDGSVGFAVLERTAM